MKRIITLILAITILSICVSASADLYTVAGQVYAVDTQLDCVIVDLNGEWFVFMGAEGWEEGEFCSVSLDDMGTEEVEDDIILMTAHFKVATNVP